MYGAPRHMAPPYMPSKGSISGPHSYHVQHHDPYVYAHHTSRESLMVLERRITNDRIPPGPEIMVSPEHFDTYPRDRSPPPGRGRHSPRERSPPPSLRGRLSPPRERSAGRRRMSVSPSHGRQRGHGSSPGRKKKRISLDKGRHSLERNGTKDWRSPATSIRHDVKQNERRSRSPIHRGRGSPKKTPPRIKSRKFGSLEREPQAAVFQPLTFDEKPTALTEGEILIKNLPKGITWRDIDDLFVNKIGSVTYSEVLDGGRTAIVKFKTLNHAKKAADKMQNYLLKDRRLSIIETTAGFRRDQIKSDPMNGTKSSYKSGASTETKWGYTFGLSHNFLESLKIKPPLTEKVFVENLATSITPYKLSEVFNIAGKVTHVNISYDASSRSKGFAIVEYEHPVEAVQAISMLNNQLLLSRRLKVSLHQESTEKLKCPEGLEGFGMGLGANGVPLRNVSKLMEKHDNDDDSETKSVIVVNEEDERLAKSDNYNYPRRPLSPHSPNVPPPPPPPHHSLPPRRAMDNYESSRHLSDTPSKHGGHHNDRHMQDIPGKHGLSHHSSERHAQDKLPPNPLKEFEEKVIQMACTRDGSAILEKKLESGSIEEQKVIFSQVISSLVSIGTDLHGVIVVMKLLEESSSMQKHILLNLLKTKGPGFKNLAHHRYAYKVVRRAIEVCPLTLQLEILSELKDCTVFLSKHIHGRHVIETCLEVLQPVYIEFMIQEIKGHVVDLLRDMDGFLVIKKILLQLPQKLSGSVFNEILQNVSIIITDPCGHKIINTLLENGHTNDTFLVIEALKGVFIFLSQNKTAVPLITKCISLAHAQQIDWILNEICGRDDAGLVVMLKDQNAHQVLLDLLKACNPEQKEYLIKKIQPYMDKVRQLPFGDVFCRAMKQLQYELSMQRSTRPRRH